jgi:hypothetical protein
MRAVEEVGCDRSIGTSPISAGHSEEHPLPLRPLLPQGQE